jgi:hypothetical protein
MLGCFAKTLLTPPAINPPNAPAPITDAAAFAVCALNNSPKFVLSDILRLRLRIGRGMLRFLRGVAAFFIFLFAILSFFLTC